MLKISIAMAATLGLATGYIPLLIAGYRTKHVEGVSMGVLVFMTAGVLLWDWYAVLNSDMTFFFANSLLLLFMLPLIGMKIYYDRSK